MAGSLKYFRYVTDTGFPFGVLMDEDWGEVVSNADVAAASTEGLYGIPKNLKPRYAVYRSPSGRVVRNIVVCDSAATTLDLPPIIVIAADTGEVSEGGAADNTLNLFSLVGERFRVIIGLDTGLNDGTAD